MGDWAVIDGVNTILGDGIFAVVEDEEAVLCAVELLVLTATSPLSWKLYSDTLLILFL
jgi:hypothetical protein